MLDELKQCPNGHYYRGNKCPICQTSSNSNGDEMPSYYKPDNYLVWSILSMVLCCLPFGIVATSYASKVDRLWHDGEHKKAATMASRARLWFWLSVVIGFVVQTIYIMDHFRLFGKIF